jgi:hypothetical protein
MQAAVFVVDVPLRTCHSHLICTRINHRLRMSVMQDLATAFGQES